MYATTVKTIHNFQQSVRDDQIVRYELLVIEIILHSAYHATALLPMSSSELKFVEHTRWNASYVRSVIKQIPAL